MDELRPTSETTVLDVGVDEVGFGAEGGQSGCGRTTSSRRCIPGASGSRRSVSTTVSASARATRGPLRPGRRLRPAVCGRSFDVVFSNAVIEHVGARAPAAFVTEALRVGRASSSRPRIAGSRSRFTRDCRSSTGSRSRAGRAYELAGKGWAKENHLLGSGDLRATLPREVRIVHLGLTLVAIT